jgi:hypothetical protein
MRLDFEGVHFLANGSIFGLAEPSGYVGTMIPEKKTESNVCISRHVDIRYIPAIVPEAFQNDTARAIEPELISRVNKVTEMIDAGIIDQESTSELNCNVVSSNL